MFYFFPFADVCSAENVDCAELSAKLMTEVVVRGSQALHPVKMLPAALVLDVTLAYTSYLGTALLLPSCKTVKSNCGKGDTPKQNKKCPTV